MKKAKNISWLLSLLLLFIGAAGVNAQFDDLYFDEADIDNAEYTEDAYAYEDYDDAVLEEGSYDYDEDEYDEYLSYRENEYEVDAYRYTNRFNNLRYSNFYSRSGYLANPYTTSFIGDPYGYSAFRRPGLSINLGFGSPYASTFNPYSNRFGRSNSFGGLRGGYGYGGFGVGRSSAYYCPPYNPISRNLRPTVSNVNSNTSNSVSRSRRTGSTTTSSRVTNSRRTNTTKANTRSTSRRSTRATSPRSSRSSATSRSSSSRRSYTPSRSSSRSSSTRSSSPRSSSSRSSSSRSSSPRSSSSSSSRRSPR